MLSNEWPGRLAKICRFYRFYRLGFAWSLAWRLLQLAFVAEPPQMFLQAALKLRGNRFRSGLAVLSLGPAADTSIACQSQTDPNQIDPREVDQGLVDSKPNGVSINFSK